MAFGPQRDALLDPSQFRCLCTTRRAGKSTEYVLDMLQTATTHARTSTIYLNTTRERAQRTVWEELKTTNAQHGLGFVPNESRLAMHGANGSWIFVSGGESKKHVDKWKGVQPRVAGVYIDEAQDWDETVLEHAIARVILPALADMGGRLTVAGTPGPMPEGTFYGMTRNPEWSQHAWSLFDNPHLRDPRGELAKVLQLRGVDEQDATVQREYFGRWVRDTQALVFGALDDDANAYDGTPDIERAVFGVDFGFVDSSSVEAVGWHRNRQGLYVVHDEAWAGVGPTDTIQRIAGIVEAWRPKLAGIVGDPGGGGKGMMDDLWHRFGTHIENAQKLEKVTACRLMADAIRSRELRLPREATDLRRDLRRVQWDPDARGVRLKGHTPDRVDALLYAFREAWPQYRYTEPPKPKSHADELVERILRRQQPVDDDL